MRTFAILLLLISASLSAPGAPKAACILCEKTCTVLTCTVPDPLLNCVELPSNEDQCCPDFDCAEKSLFDYEEPDFAL